MKKLLFLSITLSILVYSQENQIANKQFMLGCTNVESSEQVTHYIQAEGSVWSLTTGSGVITSNQQAYSNSLVTTGNANFGNPDWPGFNFIWLDQGIQMPRWGMGFYKVTNSKQSDKYFYLDARDYSYGSITGGYNNPDFFVFFNNSQSKYYYNCSLPQPDIATGSVLRIWQIFNKTPNTANLQNYWSNVLVLVNQANHPRIIWGPYQENSMDVQYYKIYKKKGTGNFSLLTTTTGLEYTDLNETIPPQPSTQVPVYYYVKAFGQLSESNYESAPTNTVSINVNGGFEKVKLNTLNKSLNEFDLSQNYPNPFNPITTISFSLPKAGYVSLRIFDIIGNQVTELVKEFKPEGNYEVQFDAKDLPSGIYVYTLNVNGHFKSQKMILMK
jgi:hypothetical protein